MPDVSGWLCHLSSWPSRPSFALVTGGHCPQRSPSGGHAAETDFGSERRPNLPLQVPVPAPRSSSAPPGVLLTGSAPPACPAVTPVEGPAPSWGGGIRRLSLARVAHYKVFHRSERPRSVAGF